jgi:hypothetical protein
MKDCLIPAATRRGLVAAMLLCVHAATASAADYFVSASGSDANSGMSAARAWQSIGKVNSIAFRPGDRILFEGGTTFRGTLAFGVDDAGTAAQPIAISSYGSGRATLDAGTGVGIRIYNTAGFAVSDLNIVGSGPTTNTGSGILLRTDLDGDAKVSYVRVDRVEVSGFGESGIEIRGDNGQSGFRDVRITGCEIHNNAGAGIATFGDRPYAHADIYIGHCRVHDNTGIPGRTRHSGNGIVFSSVDGAVIERCVTYQNGALNTANGGPIGIWAYDSTRITIQFNESYRNRTNSESDGGGFGLDGGITNSVMQYNYSHENDGAGYMLAQYYGASRFAGNTLRYNISQNDGRKNGYSAIDIYNGGSSIDDVEIYNNTVFVGPVESGRMPRAFRMSHATTNVHVRNNIFSTTGGVPIVEIGDEADHAGLLLQGNAYWSGASPLTIRWGRTTFRDLAAWREATGQEQRMGRNTGLNVDPRLADPGDGSPVDDADKLDTLANYRLADGSPLIDAGLDLRDLFGVDPGPHDYYANTVPQGAGFDIGAHERAVEAQQRPPTR